MSDFIGFYLLLAAILCFALIVGYYEAKDKEAFIAECTADCKLPYECEALWRAGERNSTAIIMTPVYGR